MNRKLARSNIATGLMVAAVAAAIFGLTFVAAALYID
jgi:hypothetical protein